MIGAEVETAELLAEADLGSSAALPLPGHPAAAFVGDVAAAHAEVERLLVRGQIEQAFR